MCMFQTTASRIAQETTTTINIKELILEVLIELVYFQTTAQIITIKRDMM
jgi:hypothetical protein